MSKSPMERQKAGNISIADLSSGSLADISKMISSIRVSYTMTMASELTFTVIDPDMVMLSKNYFAPGRQVIYTSPTLGTIGEFLVNPGAKRVVSNIDQLFEIARVAVSQGPGNSPQIQVSCYSMAVQQMKRDKHPESIQGAGSSYAQKAALKYGLKFAFEKTTKKKTINKASGDKQAESLWQVLEKLAQDAKFVIYEINGTLVFASQKFLLNKWGTYSEESITWDKKKKRFIPKINKYIPLVYPSVPTIDENGKIVVPDFEIIGFPNLEYSENDSYDGRGSLNLARHNATQLRPGMTIDIKGIPQFSGRYLIDGVSFDDLSPNAVAITFKKPELTEKEKTKRTLAIGTIAKQTNEFFRKDPSQTGDFGLLSSKTRKLIPDSERFLGITPPPESPARAKANLFPLPSSKNELRYPRVPKTMSANIYAYGNIGLWSRPIFKDEVGIYPLDISIIQVTELLISPDPIYVLLPNIHIEDGEPQKFASENEVLAQYVSDGLFLAKVKDVPTAYTLKTILDQQQVYILSERFPRPYSDFVEHSLYPLPTNIQQQNYPFIGEGLIVSGNMDLFSVPIYEFLKNGKSYIQTLGIEIKENITEVGFNNDSPFSLLLQTIISESGVTKKITLEQAYRKYKENGLFLGKCTSSTDAFQYSRLIQQQQMILMNTRATGKNYLDNWYTNG